METIGLSPKVWLPLVVNVALGAALVAIGERELGVGLLLAAASGAGFGYVASPGISVPKAVDETWLGLSDEDVAGEPLDASDQDGDGE